MKDNSNNISLPSNNTNINNINVNDNLINNNELSFSQNIINESPEKKVIEKISDLFSNICQDNKNEFNKDKLNLIKPFITFNPSISIRDYLERFYKYSKINISTIILILIYIDRITNFNKFKLTYYNIHKLILSSMVVAIKYNEDEFYSMIFYAKLGGVTKAEMIFLEYYFVTLINFNLFISDELFNKYKDYITSTDSEEEENEEEEDSSENNNNINNDANNNNFINKNNK